MNASDTTARSDLDELGADALFEALKEIRDASPFSDLELQYLAGAVLRAVMPEYRRMPAVCADSLGPRAAAAFHAVREATDCPYTSCRHPDALCVCSVAAAAALAAADAIDPLRQPFGPDKTTDIVTRLRQFHAETVASDGGESGQMAMMREAADEIERLRRLLDGVMIVGNHLATHIDLNGPTWRASYDEGLEYYGAGLGYDAWCCWKRIMLTRADMNRGPNPCQGPSGTPLIAATD